MVCANKIAIIFIFFRIFVCWNNYKITVMKVILLLFSLLIPFTTIVAKTLKFSEEMWSFGTIAEEGGVVSHTFKIENGGSTPVVIYNVSTSCGCTTTKYSRKPIVKGAEIDLEITYDPMFRPGRFSKSIFVYTSASNDPVVLKIEGDVTPRVLPIEERYPYKLLDDFRVGTLFVNFRAVPHGRLVQQSVEFRNMTDRERRVEFRPRTKETPLQLHFEERVAANTGASLEIGYYIESGRGHLADTVDIYIDGQRIDRYISVKGLIVE